MFTSLAQFRLHESTLVNPRLTELTANFAAKAKKPPTALLSVTPQAIDGAKNIVIGRSPETAKLAIEKRFAVLTNVFDALDLLDTEPGAWTGGGRILQKNPGDRDAIEAALDNGDHYIVTENPQSIPNPILHALDIKAVTLRQMYFDANQEIPLVIGSALGAHYRRTGLSQEFYEAFLETSGLGFLIPRFRENL